MNSFIFPQARKDFLLKAVLANLPLVLVLATQDVFEGLLNFGWIVLTVVSTQLLYRPLASWFKPYTGPAFFLWVAFWMLAGWRFLGIAPFWVLSFFSFVPYYFSNRPLLKTKNTKIFSYQLLRFTALFTLLIALKALINQQSLFEDAVFVPASIFLFAAIGAIYLKAMKEAV